MNYTMMIYQSADVFAARNDPQQREAFWGAFLPYAKSLFDAGIVVGSAGLQDL